MNEEPLQEEIHWRDYLYVLDKRKWVILSFLLVLVITVTIASLVMTPVYQATVKILIEKEQPKVLDIKEVIAIDAGAQEYYQTQYEIIKSRPVMQKTVEALDLVNKKPGWAKAQEPALMLQKMIEVKPIRNTRLVSVNVQDKDPQMAADIANMVGTMYTRYNLEMKLKGTREALIWLSEQMNDLRAKVQDSEAALQRYKETHGILNIDQQQKVFEERITIYQKALLEAKAQRINAESRLNEIRKVERDIRTDKAAIIFGDQPMIQKLRSNFLDLEVQLSKALKTYKEKHPEVVKLRSQIKQLEEQINYEMKLLISGIENEIKIAQTKENSFQGALDGAKREMLGLNEKEIQFAALKRDAESNQQMYEVVLKRLKETGLSGGLEANNIRIVEPAEVPRVPVRPRKGLNILLSLIIGLGLGVGLAFFMEYLDDSIKTPSEIERYLNMPLLGLIPLEGKKEPQSWKAWISRRLGGGWIFARLSGKA